MKLIESNEKIRMLIEEKQHFEKTAQNLKNALQKS